jgi:hypothetical protein
VTTRPHDLADLNGHRRHQRYEALALELRIFGLAIVPGLMQTEAYTRALFTAARSKQVEKQVALRLARQEALFRPDPPELWVLLDQAVLDRPIGGRRVMAEQLARLGRSGKASNSSPRRRYPRSPRAD